MNILLIKQQSNVFRLLLFVLFFLLVGFLQAADIDVNKLLKIAKKEKKHIVFFHHIPGCPYCKAMLDENFKDKVTLKELSKNFLHVDIYTANNDRVIFKDFKGNPKEFSSYIGAVVYPSTIFVNYEGEIIHKALGYRNIDEYLIELKYVSSMSYKVMDLETYAQKIELEEDWK